MTLTTTSTIDTSMRFTWKSNFTLFDVICNDVGTTSHSALLGPNKKPKMATSDLKCEFYN